MTNIESALKLLAQGEFVCSVRYPEEHAALDDPANRARAEQWLGAIGYRLARTGEEGAFFMAHAVLTADVRNKVREQIKNMRDKLEPVVAFMEILRQAQGRNAQLQPGDVLWETEIAEAVRMSVILERHLTDLRDIPGKMTDSAMERVRKILSVLESEGYLVETNPNHKAYQVTGKVTYLYLMLQFMAENTPHLEESAMIDKMETQQELLDGKATGS